MSYSDDVMQSLVYRLRDFNNNMPTMKKLCELLEKDIALREKEYELRLYELSKRGITEEEIHQAVLRLKK